MSSIEAAIIGLFAAVVVISFGLQFIVASKLYNDPVVIVVSMMRGTRVFLQGWRRADELKIRDLMQFWTAAIVVLVMMICPVAYIGVQRDSDTETINSSSSGSTFNPNASPTPLPYGWQITYPPYGSQVRRGTFLDPIQVEIRGWVQFDPQQIEFFRVHVCEIRNDNGNVYPIPCGAEQGSERYEPLPTQDSVLFVLDTSMLMPGPYAIGIGFQHRNSDRYDSPTEQRDDQQVWITIVE
ncbi:MAG: hypothetical protein K8L91_15015 [Anaerolineae bacterium]|nr:hypothetical protein [Anaerolineae bacterium]